MTTREAFARIVQNLLQGYKHYPESDATGDVLTPQNSIEDYEAQRSEDPAPTTVQGYMPEVVGSMLSHGGSWLREAACKVWRNIEGLLRAVRTAKDNPGEAQSLLPRRPAYLQYSRYWWDSEDDSDDEADSALLL